MPAFKEIMRRCSHRTFPEWKNNSEILKAVPNRISTETKSGTWKTPDYKERRAFKRVTFDKQNKNLAHPKDKIRVSNNHSIDATTTTMKI